MFIARTFLLFIFIPVIFVSSSFSDYMTKTVRKQNISIETHFITTSDGYILRLYHIPPVRKPNDTQVIFFMHGLFSASPSYVLYPKYSAGYYFHDHGYDVWFGNGRGNSYSRNHTFLDPEKSEFWKFSWHEISTIDLPAMIDYTLEKTNKKKIFGCEDHFDLVIKANIPLESHYVTTEDGYILNMFRLTQANSSKVMFLMHGLLASATTYVAISKNTSAGFFFHSLGYDVWMGNARGNKFSRNHTTLDPEEKPFWEFSWHEIGYYDLPAMIDYVLAVTDQSNLSYIGHSQGVTSVFVMLAERPEYNAKIKLFHAMTPPVIMKYFNKYFQPMANAVASLEGWEKMLGYYEIFPYDATKWLFNYYAEFCKYSLTKDLCKKTFEISIGPFAPNSYSKEYAFVFKRLMMFGCSYKQIMHYFQLSLTDRFQKFDFGSEENQRIYGSTQPPEYNISNFRVPTHILYGTSDYLAMASHIPALLKKIDHMVIAVDKFDSFNHLDFVNGRLVQSVQTRILNVIKKFEQ